jgi:hypothetical protein
MIRLYIRKQKSTYGPRVWKPVGWICEKCNQIKLNEKIEGN